ncbi:MAG: 5'-methylthioadenosine/adenosylhomocysteine nucleosidase [Clostridia bacterium]|nr:5'-methylthioadenosine/adenosylhomocysteine nucleosidase [Clostridia bacterium]
MLGIIGAMQVEIDSIVSSIENKKETVVSGVSYFEGSFYGKEVVVACCGVGKVFSGVCAQTMILKFGVDRILNIGVGGTLTDKLNICDLGIASGVVQHDMDTSPLGDPVGLISGINVIEIKCDEEHVLIWEQAAQNIGVNSCKGVIASGDCFVSSSEKKKFIKENFDAIVCEMEGAAIGQVCYINKIPFNVIRAVSDNADGSADMDFPQFTKKAVEQSMLLLKEYIKLS